MHVSLSPSLGLGCLKGGGSGLTLLDDESLAQKYVTLSLNFLAGQINRTILLGPKTNMGYRTMILVWREYERC